MKVPARIEGTHFLLQNKKLTGTNNSVSPSLINYHSKLANMFFDCELLDPGCPQNKSTRDDSDGK